jgi:hypothetical protein
MSLVMKISFYGYGSIPKRVFWVFGIISDHYTVRGIAKSLSWRLKGIKNIISFVQFGIFGGDSTNMLENHSKVILSHTLLNILAFVFFLIQKILPIPSLSCLYRSQGFCFTLASCI